MATSTMSRARTATAKSAEELKKQQQEEYLARKYAELKNKK